METEDVLIKIEGFIDLVNKDESMNKVYGDIIKDYYELPIASKRHICKIAYDCINDKGEINIEFICKLINKEKELLTEEDPVIKAIKENNKLYEKRPKINFTGMKYNI